MPSKKEIIETVDGTVNKPSYSKQEVKALITSVSNGNMGQPSKLKKGDVYLSSVGAKVRPVVISKVVDDMVIGIPLSTTEDQLNLCGFKSRFMGEHYFSKQVLVSTYDHAMKNFCGVFDNNVDLNKAIKLMKQFYNEVL